jgi:hypothetical protein
MTETRDLKIAHASGLMPRKRRRSGNGCFPPFMTPPSVSSSPPLRDVFDDLPHTGCAVSKSGYITFIHHHYHQVASMLSAMLSKFTLTDKLLFAAAFLSLIFSEITFFSGHKEEAIFVGLWVPSILGFGVYLKLIGASKNG